MDGWQTACVVGVHQSSRWLAQTKFSDDRVAQSDTDVLRMETLDEERGLDICSAPTLWPRGHETHPEPMAGHYEWTLDSRIS